MSDQIVFLTKVNIIVSCVCFAVALGGIMFGMFRLGRVTAPTGSKQYGIQNSPRFIAIIICSQIIFMVGSVWWIAREARDIPKTDRWAYEFDNRGDLDPRVLDLVKKFRAGTLEAEVEGRIARARNTMDRASGQAEEMDRLLHRVLAMAYESWQACDSEEEREEYRKGALSVGSKSACAFWLGFQKYDDRAYKSEMAWLLQESLPVELGLAKGAVASEAELRKMAAILKAQPALKDVSLEALEE